MAAIVFTRNERPTIGVELELQLVDQDTFALASRIEDILAALPEHLREVVKPELMQSYIEINTGVCETVSQAGEDLQSKLEAVEKEIDKLGIRLLWAATHPFSSWRDQVVTVDDRYYRLVELMQDVARRLVTFGLHVHVGVDTGDKAINICDRMRRYLPLLLAMSSNSPFWENRKTGLHSNRSKIMEGLPTAGLPHQMRNWSEYVWVINHLITTGFINSIREIWWDIRPHHSFGTVEVRVCDMPPNLNQVLGITALVQCLVTVISDEVDEGTYQLDYHPMMVQQNKWRATRFGAAAQLVNSDDNEQYSVTESVTQLVERLRPVAEKLNCSDELESALTIPARTGAEQQLAIYEETGDKAEVVRRMIEQNHWSKFA
ncbi:MAG: YbdK family carboxylate-amine ligase [Planctomycetota bacterium]|nr:YbdK family carboxylate-amine ligase [Planctomycetota bacterium]